MLVSLDVMESVSHGRLVQGGTWYDPLVTLSLKLPVGSLLILFGASIGWIVDHRRLDDPGLNFAIPTGCILRGSGKNERTPTAVLVE